MGYKEICYNQQIVARNLNVKLTTNYFKVQCDNSARVMTERPFFNR